MEPEESSGPAEVYCWLGVQEKLPEVQEHIFMPLDFMEHIQEHVCMLLDFI